MSDSPTDRVLADVAHVRRRQDLRWGEQNHPALAPCADGTTTRTGYEASADRWKEINDARARASDTIDRCPAGASPHPHTAWDGILLEEVYEALAEEDPAAVRAELVQVAAVAVAWIEAIDRRTARAEDGAR
ncbi:hypothetical protein [Streptomyces hainanensis]|uniref:Uncharacterized protein n=1 Tax=Streptomyces hainanensis TaxID=402648 RepID=A0A4R4SYK8_9ACTN|nr:hypothetical protein [Streptomyces hainanensis]TDC67602.1 hypothetical protein E1283_28615 [Streptomyces hainanensis]